MAQMKMTEEEEILLQISNTKRWLKYLKSLLKAIEDKEKEYARAKDRGHKNHNKLFAVNLD